MFKKLILALLQDNSTVNLSTSKKVAKKMNYSEYLNRLIKLESFDHMAIFFMASKYSDLNYNESYLTEEEEEKVCKLLSENFFGLEDSIKKYVTKDSLTKNDVTDYPVDIDEIVYDIDDCIMKSGLVEVVKL